ncbi:hypothetical protein KSS87_004167 [Heliosperma pusillum]|nr:hypothetical protein KSS87_004167 [Heliosperma pusillum]
MSAATAATTSGESAKYGKQTSQSYREECWTAEETETLMEAWGSLHLSLNRGGLRQHQWSYVSAAVNESNHRRRHRSDAQCKNRIDTLKKKFKLEKAKVSEDPDYVSPWPFFSRLDFLIAGDGPNTETPVVETPVLRGFPVKRRSALPKRPARWLTEDKDSEEGQSVRSGSGSESEKEEEDDVEGGWRTLAGAIRRLGEVYERVESMKQEKVIELEMHRMQFTKDLEYQRIKLLMDTHLQLLSRFKRSKPNHPNPNPHLG